MSGEDFFNYRLKIIPTQSKGAPREWGGFLYLHTKYYPHSMVCIVDFPDKAEEE